MKLNCVLLTVLLCTAINAVAQQSLFIPDTLSGTGPFNLSLNTSTVQFLPGQLTQTVCFNNYNYLGPTIILQKGQVANMMVNNQLTDTSTVHWHGLHVPAMDDGGPHTVILPGATWSPQFTVMNNASTFWYHPHMHMKTAQQVMKGAAGLIIVRDSAEAALNLPRSYAIDDIPLIVQCQQFDSVNQIMFRGMQDSILMVNGTINPFLNIPSQVVRMRLLNASQERNFNFGFTGNKQFYVIGNDGGLLQAPVAVTRMRLAPGERAEILADFSGMNGQITYLMSYASEIPMGVQGGPTMPMPPWAPPMDSPLNGVDFNILQLNIVAQTANPVTAIPASLVTVTPWLESQSNITRTINFTADSAMVMDGPFYFNGLSFDMMRIDYLIPLNNIEIWSLTNQTMVSHSFHIHDVQFFVLDRDGIQPLPEEKGYKDVVLVAPNETVRFITKFEDFADTTMPYMFHCHMLMHEDDGMMGQFIVLPNASGISENNSANNFSVYPNPADENFNILFNLKEQSDVLMDITDLAGRQVMLLMNDKQNGLVSKKINTSPLLNGNYFVRLIVNGITTVQKLNVVH